MEIVSPTQKERLASSGILTSIVGALLVGCYSAFVPGRPITHAAAVRDLTVSGLAFLVYLAVAIPFGHRYCVRSVTRATEAVEAGDVDKFLRLPLTVARMTLWIWLIAAVVFTALQFGLDHDAYRSLRNFDAVALAGCITAASEYLGAEWILRPSFGKVLRGRAPQRPSTISVRHRLRLSWVLGSGVPLLAIVLTPFSLGPGTHVDLVPTFVVLGCLGLLVGWLLAERSARSVTEPLGALKEALARVEAGDLDVVLEVNDGGDIGTVQSGFNAALEGLRDRRRIEQLFGMQVGREVAQLAIERGAHLGVERTECSVLFVDVISSSALVNSLPPEEVARLLSRLFDVVVRAVHAEGGWVNKFQGDGAMCVFGPPANYDDHAARALRASRTLRRELLALSVESTGFDAAVGVSSGDVVAGTMGSADRYEYTVLGRPVHEAARLTEAAKQRLGRVLASEETVERAGREAAAWVVSTELQLRGVPHPVRTFEPAPAAEVVSPPV